MPDLRASNARNACNGLRPNDIAVRPIGRTSCKDRGASHVERTVAYRVAPLCATILCNLCNLGNLAAAAGEAQAQEARPIAVAADPDPDPGPPRAIAAAPAERVLAPFCFAGFGRECATAVPIELGMGAGANLHGGDWQAIARGHVSAGLRRGISESLRLGPVVDVGFEVSGNEQDDKAIGWYVLPKLSLLWSTGHHDLAFVLASGPSLTRTFHARGSDLRVGAVSEAGVSLGEVALVLVNEQLFDPIDADPVQLRSYFMLRATPCGIAESLTMHGVRCR